MWHKPCRTFHPWCPCIKTRCLFQLMTNLTSSNLKTCRSSCRCHLPWLPAPRMARMRAVGGARYCKQIQNRGIKHRGAGWRCDTTSYRMISQNLEATRCPLRVVSSLWNLTGVLAAMLARRLSNSTAIQPFQHTISRLRDFAKSYDKCLMGYCKNTKHWMNTVLLCWCWIISSVWIHRIYVPIFFRVVYDCPNVSETTYSEGSLFTKR